MKKLFPTILILMLILGLCSCNSNNQSTVENDAEQEMEENADTVQTEVRKPVSDVVDGTGIEGTWEGKQKGDGYTNDVILALNSDKTYQIWYGDSGDTGASADAFGGTYTTDDNNLSLTPDEVDDAEGFAIGDGTYPFTLDGDKLTIKDNDGKDIIFNRDKED